MKKQLIYKGFNGPYGYRYSKEVKKLEVHTEEAKIVKEIYDMYVSGKTTYKDRQKKVYIRTFGWQMNDIYILGQTTLY